MIERESDYLSSIGVGESSKRYSSASMGAGK